MRCKQLIFRDVGAELMDDKREEIEIKLLVKV